MIGNTWKKSSRSNACGCVEVKLDGIGDVMVRDSKLGDGSPVLTFNHLEWKAFVGAVRDGEFDL